MDHSNNPLGTADLLTGLTIDYPHNPLGDTVCALAQGWFAMDQSILNLGLSMGLYIPPPPVGGGECTHLVEWALLAAGAKPGDTSDPTHYVWGDEVTRVVFPDPPIPGPVEWGTWQVGDIIQFWDAKFEWVSWGWHVEEPGADDPAKRRHTAIILRPPLVSINPRLSSSHPWDTWLIHQNDGGARYVTTRLFYLRHLVRGQFIVYRPVLAR